MVVHTVGIQAKPFKAFGWLSMIFGEDKFFED